MIDVDKPRYDQSTYLGRLKHFSELTDPRNLLASNAEIHNAQRLLQEYKAGKVVANDETIWAAKKLVDSSIHPDTGEPVVLPFRMASFIPTNLPLIAGMLVPNQPISMILGLQWLNQSVNVAFNYANANKTTPLSMEETGIAYAGAVASSMSIAFGLNHWVKNKAPVNYKSILSRIVPFCAVAAAGTVNVYLMRRKELVEGIEVSDENGNVLGKSTVAGGSAIKQVAVSRIVTAAPALFIPGMIMTALEKTAFLKRNRWLTTPLNLLTVTGSLLVALPCAIALYPQQASLPVEDVEAKFQNQGYKRIFFNRGL